MAHRRQDVHSPSGDGSLALAQGLGWFSIGLGVAELAAPAQLARFLGMEEHTQLIRAYGAREIVTGIGSCRRRIRPSGCGAASAAMCST
jgi:hypothetical protein